MPVRLRARLRCGGLAFLFGFLCLARQPAASAPLFDAAYQVLQPGISVGDLSAGDLNGDGCVDLVCGGTNAQGSFRTVVLVNRGDGTFDTDSVYTTTGFVVTADLNGDGYLDAMGRTTQSVYVRLGSGTGKFGPPTEFPVGAITGTGNIAVGDVNHDGKLDLAIATGSSSSPYGNTGVYVVPGNGDGTFGPSLFLQGTCECSHVVIADLNHDGYGDIVVSNAFYVGCQLAGPLSVFLANPQGGFAARVDNDTYGGVSGFALGDLDGDGNLDAVMPGPTGISLFFGQSNGTFDARVDRAMKVTGYWPTLVDLNGDGALDLVMSGASTITVAFGRGDGTFEPSILYPAGVGGGVVVADVNCDGRLDMLEPQPSSGVAVFLANADGSFGQAIGYAAGTQGAIAMADVDRDGDRDLIALDLSADVRVLLANGSGGFLLGPAFGVAYQPSAVEVGDADGDGLVDVLTANAETVSMLRGLGNGYFDARIDSPAPQACDLSMGDLNGDGRPDLALATMYSNQIALLFGNGDGTFGSRSTLVAAAQLTRVTIADLNADGKPDVLATTYVAATTGLSVFFGHGNGTFEPRIDYGLAASPISDTLGIQVCDVNADGRSDVVLAGVSRVHVLLGAGAGALGSPQTFPVANAGHAVAVADVTGDLVPDLLVPCRDQTLSVWPGRGDGSFGPESRFGILAPSRDLAIADLDGDGRNDVIASGGGRITTLHNVGADVSVPTLLTLFDAMWSAGAIRVRWSLEGIAGPDVRVERSERTTGPWSEVGAERSRDPSGWVLFDDSVVSGHTYAYRLRTAAGVTFGPVIVPGLPSSSVFSITPNPASRSMSIRFMLGTRDRIRIRLTDVQGRLISSRDVGELEPGLHVVPMSPRQGEGGLRAGLYFVTLEGETIRSSTRVVIAP